MNYKELRTKYPEFIYKSFDVSKVEKDLKISFIFEVGEIRFTPFVLIKNVPKVNVSNLQTYAFNLGLIEMVSYWKATCSPKIIIKAGFLDDYQKEWWKNLYINGLGQFFYENKIDFTKDNIFEFVLESDIKLLKKTQSSKILNKVLLAFSGGIDSTLSLEILSHEGAELGLFMLNPTVNIIKIAEEYSKAPRIIIQRSIDPDLLSLNNKGYLNGHTPISAYLAFLSVLCAEIFDYGYVLFSNERSSNETNVKYLGMEINHQYSKTFEFEINFREYSQKYLSSNLNYLSFLRPLYNLQISKIFSENKFHFTDVKSCNVNQKSGTWCLTCPKCLSTYILLSPFLSKNELLKIFEGNIFDDLSLLTLLESLVDETKVKPFECVGTRKEIIIALYLTVKKYKGQDLPLLLDMANKNILTKYKNLESLSNEFLKSWNAENNLSVDFERTLKKYV